MGMLYRAMQRGAKYKGLRGNVLDLPKDCAVVIIGYKGDDCHMRPCAHPAMAEKAIREFKQDGLERVEFCINVDYKKGSGLDLEAW